MSAIFENHPLINPLADECFAMVPDRPVALGLRRIRGIYADKAKVDRYF